MSTNDIQTPSSNDPDEIRRQIEATRAELSTNVNALAESVQPGNVAKRQVDRVKSGAVDLKDRVMGTVDDLTPSGGGAVGEQVGNVRDAATSAPSAVRRQTRGNPMAAGLVAFGVGWLVASLLPASSAEQQAATALKEKAQPLTDQVTEAAKDVASNLKEPLQQAAAEVKSTAADATSTVKDEAAGQAQGLSGSVQDAAGEVQKSAQS
jgi:uncharacterized protein YjbJ (UPF0337 family)